MSNAIIDAINRHAVQSGQRIALSSATASISYAQLASDIGTLAKILQNLDVDRVGLDMANGIPWALADLAAIAAGVTLIPLPSFFTPAQINHVVDTADIGVMLCADELLHRWMGSELWTKLSESPFGIHMLKREGTAAATGLGGKITFTSGSSGQPKGVLLSAATIAATSTGIVEALAPLNPRQHLCVLPLATLLENVAGLYAPLLNGSEVQLLSDAEIGLTGASLDIERFASLLNASQADTMILVPQLLTAVVTLVELGALTPSSFKLIAVGGGRVGRSLHDRAQALELPVFEGYGLSECCSVLTLNLPKARRTGSVGRLLNHTTLRIAENGEIQVKSPQMDGYIGDSQSKQDWYATGDLGHLDADGYLYIDGRARNVFITAFGRNVNPEWPEAALTQHAAIGQALVYGEAQDHNLGLLWLRFSQTDTEIAGLVAAANNELPDYARIHQWIVIPGPVPSELQTANGRIKRDAAVVHFGELIESHYGSARPEAMISKTSFSPYNETLNERNHNVIL